jgi:hypothetical protein
MEKFFKENYRFPFQVFKDKKSMEGDDGLTARGITFAQFYKEHYQDQGMFNDNIGLHYGMVSGRYRSYMYAVIVWMAQAVGRRQYFQRMKQAYPYINRDEEVIPVIPVENRKEVPRTCRRFLVNKFGLITLNLAMDTTKIDNIIIRHEIKKLDILWKKENLPK